MHFKIISIFPEILNSYLQAGVLKRALDKKLIGFSVTNPRDFTNDKHRSVDDAPYGGGAGMLMKVEPLYKALQSLNKKSGKSAKKRKIILLSAGGKQWSQILAKKYSKLEEIVMICGRYEGVDARIKKFIDEEISIGEYVLTGGELPALALVDSISRLLPGVLGNQDSARDESHSESQVLEYPQYTRPEIFTAAGKKYAVPKVLLSGNHKLIDAWREKNKKRKK